MNKNLSEDLLRCTSLLKKNSLIYGLVLWIGVDYLYALVVKMGFRLYTDYNPYSLLKVIILVFLFSFNFSLYRSFIVKNRSTVLTLFLFILIGLTLSSYGDLTNNFSKNIWFILKLFIPIFFLIIYRRLEDSMLEKVEKLFLLFLIINALAIISGMLFSIEAFRSYGNDRFGYDGFFIWANDASFLHLLGAIFLAQHIDKYKDNRFIYIILILIPFFIGTKSLYICMFLFFYILNKSFSLSPYSNYILIVLGIIFIIFGFWKLVLYSEQTQHPSLAYTLTSSRNILIGVLFDYIKNYWSFWNYLFGSIPYFDYSVESEVIDILSLLGLLGGGMFFVFIGPYFFPISSKYDSYYFILILLLAILAGHVFFNSTVAIFWGLVIEKYRRKHEDSSYQQYCNSLF